MQSRSPAGLLGCELQLDLQELLARSLPCGKATLRQHELQPTPFQRENIPAGGFVLCTYFCTVQSSAMRLPVVLIGGLISFSCSFPRSVARRRFVMV